MVFVRMAGMLLTNPVFARRNVPNMVRMGLVFFLTVLVAPTVDPTAIEAMDNGILLFMAMLRELAIGMLLSIIFNWFYMMLSFAGDLMDMLFGLSMAKIFDPGTNMQVSLSSNIFFYFFMFFFFVSNSHLAVLHIFCFTFQAIPLGGALLTLDLARQMIELFTAIFLLVIRLSLPFAAMEFVLEIGMGILMRFVPQIQVFSINFQLKQILGFTMLLLFAPFIGSFIDNYLVIVLENLQSALVWMGGTI